MVDSIYFILFLLILCFIVLIAVDIIILVGYIITIIYRAIEKSGCVMKASQMPPGQIFDKSKKSVSNLVAPMEDVLRRYEEPEYTGGRVTGSALSKRMDRSCQVLRQYGVVRRLRFLYVTPEDIGGGRQYRQWDRGGKQWRACELHATAIEEYVHKADGLILQTNYYPSVKIFASMSRRLSSEDKQAASQRDKWGRQKASVSFYDNAMLTVCPSCGAELPQNTKDKICPSCGSTIYSDYYDWQIEDIGIEPVPLRLRGVIGWLIYFHNYKAAGSGVKNKKKTQIIRFSENDFRQDVYDSFIESEDSQGLVDLWLGTVEIRSIRNTDKDTILNVSIPLHKTKITEDGKGTIKVISTVSKSKAEFIRDRYPARFKKDNAAVSAEKKCPKCSAPFSPDDEGKCTYCGTYLYRDNTHWKLIQN